MIVSTPVPPTLRTTVSVLPETAVTRHISGAVLEVSALGTMKRSPAMNSVPSVTVTSVDVLDEKTVLVPIVAQRAA